MASETVDYTVSVEYEDEESPILTEDDIKKAVTDMLVAEGLNAYDVSVERQ